ncbi:GntR family transcriptional regulator [Aminipila butyrica]|uniref:GntR family transcriptional regulator n=1 Tax=Aminipila butyrica TaxID=433296 RepID=A0A858BSP2_9FIRM|nr:GntR family transcriptional regulator [Aminipila butyrica]QIB68125.1 GntR family transcriptional regulator [Aminipila butyrica]
MLNFDIQNHRPLREIVYEELKLQILTGKIAPGTRMMEVELAEDMGVSRTPIREAIRKLEKEGLVIIEPRRGAYASQISTEDMVEILEVRQNMEGLAAFIAASKMKPEQLKCIEQAEEEYNRAVETGSTADMIYYDSQFHKLIVEASNNKTLLQLIEPLQEMALRFRYLYYDDFKRAENMPHEHQVIIDAIAQGNAEAAKEAADTHIKKLKELVMTEGV